jgi:hypothetical protein
MAVSDTAIPATIEKLRKNCWIDAMYRIFRIIVTISFLGTAILSQDCEYAQKVSSVVMDDTPHLRGASEEAMRSNMALASVLGLSILMASGCAHVQLAKNTVRQARTLSDIYEQQVLDNVAKFVYNFNSLPHFAIADGGTTAVNDQLLGNGNLLLPIGTNSSLGINGQRQCNDAWTLTPISDPRKLELMRCSYQRAVGCALHCEQSLECKNCQQLINSFYTGRADTSPQEARQLLGVPSPCQASPMAQACEHPRIPIPTAAAAPPTKEKQPDQQQSAADLSGITADDLNAGCCWFRVCCAKCIGDHRHGCCKVGEYCGVYVVVEGTIGQEMLSRLTLIMLDLAQYRGVASKPPYEQQIVLTGEKQKVNDQIQAIIREIVNAGGKDVQIEQKLRQIESLQKVIEAIDRQLNPGQSVAQEQTGAGKPSALSTWQKMNVLLNPSVPPPPAPVR